MKTEQVDRIDERHTFSLILYSGPWPGAVANVAFLDRDDDLVMLEPYAPAFTFTVLKGLSSAEALARAESFVSQHNSFRRSVISKIIDDFYDRLLGYEIRPLYMRTTFGADDILDISYRRRENRIDIYIRVNPDIEQKL